MSRAGYTDDLDAGEMNLWRGSVTRAINGKRGQAFLRELIASLDAMPDKRLVTDELEADGQFCALGAVGRARGLDMSKMDTEDWDQLARTFGIAESMAREIMNENDEMFVYMREWEDWSQAQHGVLGPMDDKDSERWRYMRRWAVENLKDKP